MDKTNVDGFSIDDDNSARATRKNHAFQFTAKISQSALKQELMAPRSEPNSSSHYSRNLNCFHRHPERSLPKTQTNGPSMPPPVVNCEVGSSNVDRAVPSNSTNESSFQSASNISEECLLSEVDNRIKLLSARCRAAERRAFRILSRLNGHVRDGSFKEMPAFDEDPAEATESSSSDDERGELNTWCQDRATIHSHWSILKSEMIRAIDCLQNLNPLYNRCKKWRKSMPLLSSNCLKHCVNSRLLPFERKDKTRHTYNDLSSLSSLDYKFPGSSLPSRLNNPRCLENCHNGCIMCCPVFNSSRYSTRHLENRSTDMPSRSILLDNSRITTSFENEPRRTLLDECSPFHQNRIGDETSPFSFVSQAPCALKRSTHSSEMSVRPKISSKLISEKFPIHFKDLRSNVHGANTLSTSLQKNTSREIFTPYWRTLPPIAHQGSLLHSNWTISEQLDLCASNSSHSYKTVLLDCDIEEDTSDKHYQTLHATEERQEFLRKLPPPLHQSSLPASADND